MKHARGLPEHVGRLCFLQIILLGGNGEVARATNKALRALGGSLTIPDTVSLEYWGTEWRAGDCPPQPGEGGFPLFPDEADAEDDDELLDALRDGDPMRAIGALLLGIGGKALSRESTGRG